MDKNLNNNISVLMSVYYKERHEYLQKALESIWDKQILKPTEIIIVEDGPLTPDLYSVLSSWKKRLKDKLIRVPLDVNTGLANALNVGIKYCTGDYIARMDSDDISASTRFENQINFLNTHKNIILLGGSIQEFNNNSNNLKIRKYPADTRSARKYIVKASPFAHPAVMIRKELLSTDNLYSNEFNANEDIELWFRILKGGYEVANISDVVLHFRVSDNFYQRRSKSKAINEFKVFWNGILDLYGFTWKLAYPFLRLVLRFSPIFIVKKLYTGKIRDYLNIH